MSQREIVTELHALKSVIEEMNREDYTRFRGWEEAVIEQTQRKIRPDVLARLDIEAPEAVFLPHEAIWPYNNYIEAIETLRQAAGMALKPFYLGLLRTPLAQRPASVRSMSDAPEFRRLFALALGRMR